MIPSTIPPSLRISAVFRISDVHTEALTLRRFFGQKESVHTDSLIVLEQP